MNKKTWELLPFWFPKSQNNRNWTFVFILLIILSIDWWNWESNARFADWIPIWVIYLIMIQFALAYSVWKFSKVFNFIVIEKEFNFNEEQLKETVEKDDENEEETKSDEEVTVDEYKRDIAIPENDDNSDKKHVTNITYNIHDSVINRSIIGEKDDKDE